MVCLTAVADKVIVLIAASRPGAPWWRKDPHLDVVRSTIVSENMICLYTCHVRSEFWDFKDMYIIFQILNCCFKIHWHWMLEHLSVYELPAGTPN